MSAEQRASLKRSNPEVQMVNAYTDSMGAQRVPGAHVDLTLTSTLHQLGFIIYIDLRSGGPALKKSAEYPQGFATYIADCHEKCMVP